MTRTSPSTSPTDLPSHYVPVGTSLHSPGRQVPLRRASSSASSTASSDRRRLNSKSAPTFDELKHGGARAWDEVFPLPASSSRADQWRALRRTGSFLVILFFLVAVVGTACLGGSGDKSAVSKLPSGGFGAAHAAGSAAGNAASADSVDPKIEDDDDDSAPTALSAEEPGSFADDHSHYHLLETLPADQLRLDEPDRRVFFVGDIHGSFKQLAKLLAKIDYDADRDVFVSVGDLVAKGPKPLEVLQQMRTLGVKAVRGNHDQPVIQWRSWFEKYLPTSTFTGSEEEQAKAFATAVGDLSLADAQKIGFPKEWVWEGEHFQIARHMTRLDYAYLLSLPLQIHIPSLHAIVVHAGLLPFDPHGHKFSLDGSETSDLDALGKGGAKLPWQDSKLTRLEAELALLTEVAPNSDPWNLINMRSVLKHGEITKDGKSGTPWSDIWTKSMSQCTRSDRRAADETEATPAGEVEVEGKKGGVQAKGCYPIHVIYGHAAGRGLDIKPFSSGLDSGCVYGHRLSALVLGGRSTKGQKVMIGEHEGRIVSVSC